MYDVIIKNGMLIDGTGASMRKADVGIKGDKIKKIGDLHDERAETEIDAQWLLVCPGFIDVNNHSDTFWQIFSEPDLESLVYQGITTIVGGNCGSSLAPLASPRTIESIQKWIDLKRINVDWLKTGEFFDFMEKKKLSVNFATLAGHATLRRGILEDQMRNLVPKELDFVRKMLAESLKEGALGMSTGLIYTHARLASEEELVDLAKVVEKSGGVYATHIRGEKEELLNSVEEAIKIARESGVKLHISHLKAMGKANWIKMDQALALIDEAKRNGVDVSFDVYPYTFTGSVLYALLPAWVTDGGKRMLIHRLRDQAIRTKVISEMKDSGFDYKNVEIAMSPLDKTLARRKISEIALSQGKSIENAVLDILIASEGRVIISAEVLSEENVRKAVVHPLSIIATNGAGYSVSHAKTGEMVHSRSFGTMIRVFSKYVVKEKVLTWENAVRKMTSYPAEKFGIKKRGVLKEGNFADIAILDQGKVKDLSIKENPYQYSKGVEYLVVNGEMILKEGEYLGVREGRIIRR
ncbi:MAG: N-acyl-D-amino-acid deacylase [Patescibacteria group bacterium]|nr:N-acyl-D-amino-acid deacylase [Patescibacteria group bacterium]